MNSLLSASWMWPDHNADDLCAVLRGTLPALSAFACCWPVNARPVLIPSLRDYVHQSRAAQTAD